MANRLGQIGRVPTRASPVTLGEEWEHGIRFEHGLKQMVPLCELEAAFVSAPKDPEAWRVHSQARKLLN